MFDEACLHMPLLGKTIKKITVVRFTGTLAILIKSGIPLIHALQVTQETVVNAAMKESISASSRSIREGNTISAPLRESRLFDPMITNMIEVGEETGQLDEMLSHIADYYEGELMQAVDYMAAVIEPAMILLVSFMVGLVVVATLMPIFNMMNLINI